MTAIESNCVIADKLRQASDLLEQQEANPYRVTAYRHAADSVSSASRDLRDVFAREGLPGLLGIPGVGASIGAAIAEMLRTGRWSQLDRLRGTLDPERLFRTIPGVGAELARRIHEGLHVESLEALEVAAHDGRLAALPGFGPRRAAMIRAALNSMLGRARWRPAPRRRAFGCGPAGRGPRVSQPGRPAAEDRAAAIQSRAEGLLPILHTERDRWHFTALFSNTALAHRLGRTRDWLVIYFQTDHWPEGQRTVVTETQGALEGQRVVRGREAECQSHYGALIRPRRGR